MSPALSGGRTLAERARLCEQGVVEAGDDDARAIELLGQAAVYRLAMRRDDRSALAQARDALRRRRALWGTRELLVIAQARVAYLETHALDVTPGLLEEAVAAEAGSTRRCRSI